MDGWTARQTDGLDPVPIFADSTIVERGIIRPVMLPADLHPAAVWWVLVICLGCMPPGHQGHQTGHLAPLCDRSYKWQNRP